MKMKAEGSGYIFVMGVIAIILGIFLWSGFNYAMQDVGDELITQSNNEGNVTNMIQTAQAVSDLTLLFYILIIVAVMVATASKSQEVYYA